MPIVPLSAGPLTARGTAPEQSKATAGATEASRHRAKTEKRIMVEPLFEEMREGGYRTSIIADYFCAVLGEFLSWERFHRLESDCRSCVMLSPYRSTGEMRDP